MEVEVRDNPAESRYEALVDGELAGRIAYRDRGDARVLIHTEVEEAWEGKGVAGRLVAGALEDIRARGSKVIARCRYAAGYIERHPEYGDLVST